LLYMCMDKFCGVGWQALTSKQISFFHTTS
jgi:hypothetical protein